MPGTRYTVRPLGADTYAIEEKSPATQGLCYLLCGREKALLIDTGFGFEGLKATVEKLTDLPVTVANTHAHMDHIGGNHLFDEIWFHEDDRGIFALHTDYEYTSGLLRGAVPWPLRLLLSGFIRRALHIDPSGNYRFFGDGHIFRLGGRDIEAVHTPGHTPGSVCFLDRASRMLFAGDTVCEWGILLMLPGESCPPEVFLTSMRRLKGLWDAYDTVWPGHHGFPADKGYVDEYLACAEQIVAGTADMGRDKGRRCARYGRVMIFLPEEGQAHG